MRGFKVQDESMKATDGPPDEKIISQIEHYGYSREYILRCLQKNGLNSHVNAIYSLIKS